jgi:hypothetical protein
MAGVSVPAYQLFWTDKLLLLKTQYKDIANKCADAAPTMQQLFKVFCDTENVANSTPISFGGKQGVGCYNQLNRRQPRELL